MVQNMRTIRRKKQRRFLTPLLFIFNLFLWGSAINLWMQDEDAPPQMMGNFIIVPEI